MALSSQNLEGDGSDTGCGGDPASTNLNSPPPAISSEPQQLQAADEDDEKMDRTGTVRALMVAQGVNDRCRPWQIKRKRKPFGAVYVMTRATLEGRRWTRCSCMAVVV